VCAPGVDSSVSDFPRKMCSLLDATPCLTRHATYVVADDCGNCCGYVKQPLRRAFSDRLPRASVRHELRVAFLVDGTYPEPVAKYIAAFALGFLLMFPIIHLRCLQLFVRQIYSC
jgi:hypothetical protein